MTISLTEIWKQKLGLERHPEGGWFAEVYRSNGTIAGETLPDHAGARPFITSIYFMLAAGEVSRFHRLKSDEIWYYHAGGSLTIHQIDKNGKYTHAILGQNVTVGENLQVIVPAGVWFGATLKDGDATLVSCAVAPGFDFADFELAERRSLIAAFPQHAALIESLTEI